MKTVVRVPFTHYGISQHFRSYWQQQGYTWFSNSFVTYGSRNWRNQTAQ